MHVQVGDDEPDEFRLPAGKDAAHFVFLIIQFCQGVRDLLLILQCEVIRGIKIAGDRCLGKSRVCRDICECYFFLFHVFLLLWLNADCVLYDHSNYSITEKSAGRQ